MATTFSDQQVMMTLAALAYTDETTTPGETLAQQEQRILGDLNTSTVHGLGQVPTTRAWTAIWVGLSGDPQRSNMAYIARSTAQPDVVAVCIRGSDVGLFLDALQDFDVSLMVPFPHGGHVAQGAWDAFTRVTQAVYVPGGSAGLEGTTLLQALQRLVGGASPGTTTTIHVTGHSLGGAIATTVGLHLRAQAWSRPVRFQVHTFAAPTAGDGEFARAFDAAFPGTSPSADSSWRVYNAYDVVPNAWETLDTVVTTFYPTPPGPPATIEVRLIVLGLEAITSGNRYVQPGAAGSGNAVELNHDYRLYDPGDVAATTSAFLGQFAYQHGGNTYLQLLGAPLVTFQL